MITSWRLVGVLAVFLGAASFTRAASAQPGPGLSDRTITLVVPYSPGGGPDALARILAEELRARWNQPVVVENKPGASGNIGTVAASRAVPDGHTMLVAVNAFVMSPSLYKTAGYDPVKSFAPVVEIVTGALALVVHSSVPAKTTEEFVKLAKSQPGKLDYGTPGRGTPQHLAMELFKLTAGIDLQHIPYTGSAGATKDLLGGHVKAMFLPLHTALPLAADGLIRILAVGAEARSPQAPDVPTLAEQGMPELDVDLWYGLLAPAGTPPDIVARYNATLNEILASPSVKEALLKQGLITVGGPPDRLTTLIVRDGPRWARVVRDAHITAD